MGVERMYNYRRVFGQIKGDYVKETFPSLQSKRAPVLEERNLVGEHLFRVKLKVEGNQQRKGGFRYQMKLLKIHHSPKTMILSALPCLVSLALGVRIVNVAGGGRHTLALSDIKVLVATYRDIHDFVIELSKELKVTRENDKLYF